MIIYDCEIKKAIARPDDEHISGIEYCDGWRDFENMGISVICAYDYAENRYRCFCDDNFDDFARLLDVTDTVVGFNNHQFDDKLLAANDIPLDSGKSYDLLAEIWAGAGLAREYNGDTHKNFGLDACAKVNHGYGKTGYGGSAPVDWQLGKTGRVIDYCLQDVRLTKLLLDDVVARGWILDPRAYRDIEYGNKAIHVASPRKKQAIENFKKGQK